MVFQEKLFLTGFIVFYRLYGFDSGFWVYNRGCCRLLRVFSRMLYGFSWFL